MNGDNEDNNKHSGDTSSTHGKEENKSMDSNIDPQDQELLEEIEQSLNELNLGFNFSVLEVLDDDNATPAKIEQLKDQLGTVISARLFSLANSVRYGKVRSGQITKFVDVVKHLGTATTKSMAIFLALLALADTEELKLIAARCFATSKLAEVIMDQMEISSRDKSIISLGALFIEMGRLITLLYADKAQRPLEQAFIDKYHSTIGAKLIDRFELPDALKDIVHHPYFSFIKKDSLALSAIVDLAHAVVERSFREHGKFLAQSPLPDSGGILYSFTMGSILKEQFQSVGLGPYLFIAPSQLSELEQRFLEKHQGKY